MRRTTRGQEILNMLHEDEHAAEEDPRDVPPRPPFKDSRRDPKIPTKLFRTPPFPMPTPGSVNYSHAAGSRYAAPVLISPTPAPRSPTHTPISPTSAPRSLTHAPISPTPAPRSPTHAPISPTSAPRSLTHAPISPTPAPRSPTHAPISPTSAPRSLTHAPISPTRAPRSSTHAPLSPTSEPRPLTTAPRSQTPSLPSQPQKKESPLTREQLEFFKKAEDYEDFQSCVNELNKSSSALSVSEHDPYSTDGDSSWSPGHKSSHESSSSSIQQSPCASPRTHTATTSTAASIQLSGAIHSSNADRDHSIQASRAVPTTDPAQVTTPDINVSRPVLTENPATPPIDIPDTNNQQRKSKKRIRNAQSWKRTVAKKKRLLGEEYKSAVSVKIIGKKELKPPCPTTCRRKCNTMITEVDRQMLFNKFWEISSWDQRRQYIAMSVVVDDVDRPRKRNDGSTSRRSKTREFFLTVNDIKYRVCQKMFLNTFAISEQFVKNTLQKKTDNTTIIQADQRGKHTPSNKTPEEVIAKIKEHILSFPSYSSHYSRERSSRNYLGSELNLSKMYALYVEKCKSNNVANEKIGGEWLYRRIFNEEFNMSFHRASNDTCDTCDKFAVRLKHVTDIAERDNIEREKKAHHEDASNRYALKKIDKNEAKLSDGKKKTLMIDMQKCLPTPSLTNCQTFYLRKLWELNETILDATLNQGYCMMWNETQGARGANEVASCLIEWALNYGTSPEEITVWSDNCAGQNRNIFLVYAYCWLLQYTQIKVINHKFLLRGHTHLEVDTIHSIIERKKKQLPKFEIQLPRDWEQFVRTCKQQQPLIVHEMTIGNLRNYKTLGTQFSNRRIGINGENFSISQCVWLRVETSNRGVLYYKTAFDQENFHKVDLRRNTRQALDLPRIIPPVNTRPRKIKTAKYNDLIKLTEWIDPLFKAFYVNLRHESNTDEDLCVNE